MASAAGIAADMTLLCSNNAQGLPMASLRPLSPWVALNELLVVVCLNAKDFYCAKKYFNDVKKEVKDSRYRPLKTLESEVLNFYADAINTIAGKSSPLTDTDLGKDILFFLETNEVNEARELLYEFQTEPDARFLNYIINLFDFPKAMYSQFTEGLLLTPNLELNFERMEAVFDDSFKDDMAEGIENVISEKNRFVGDVIFKRQLALGNIELAKTAAIEIKKKQTDTLDTTAALAMMFTCSGAGADPSTQSQLLGLFKTYHQKGGKSFVMTVGEEIAKYGMTLDEAQDVTWDNHENGFQRAPSVLIYPNFPWTVPDVVKAPSGAFQKVYSTVSNLIYGAPPVAPPKEFRVQKRKQENLEIPYNKVVDDKGSSYMNEQVPIVNARRKPLEDDFWLRVIEE